MNYLNLIKGHKIYKLKQLMYIIINKRATHLQIINDEYLASINSLH